MKAGRSTCCCWARRAAARCAGSASTSRPGERPQLVIPAGTWFAVELAPEASHCLFGCTVAPGFDFADFELAQGPELAARHPEHAARIARMTAPAVDRPGDDRSRLRHDRRAGERGRQPHARRADLLLLQPALSRSVRRRSGALSAPPAPPPATPPAIVARRPSGRARCIPRSCATRRASCPICGMALEPRVVTADERAQPGARAT